MSRLEMKNGRFRIMEVHSLNVTPDNARQIALKLRSAVNTCDPGLVILNGDTVSGIADSAVLYAAASVIASAVTSRGAGFAVTFGDRDEIGSPDRSEQLEIWRSLGCLTEAGPDDIDGVGNCVIPVYDGERKAFAVRLFDSHAETTAYERDYGSPSRSRLPYPLYSHYYMDGVRFNQTMWLRDTFDPDVPEALFFHTPTPEHAQLPLNAAQVSFDGIQREEVRCQTVNGGVAMTAADLRGVMGIFCGNDERNDFFGRLWGMTFGVAPSFEASGTAHIADIAYENGRMELKASRISV